MRWWIREGDRTRNGVGTVPARTAARSNDRPGSAAGLAMGVGVCAPLPFFTSSSPLLQQKLPSNPEWITGRVLTPRENPRPDTVSRGSGHAIVPADRALA